MLVKIDGKDKLNINVAPDHCIDHKTFAQDGKYELRVDSVGC